jgi:hypothetical protein
MLAEAPGVYYLYEPFNPNAGVGRDVCDAPFERYFTYVCESNEAIYQPAIRDMLAGHYHWQRALPGVRSLHDLQRLWRRTRSFARHRSNGDVPLVKDPIALLSAEWMASRFDINVVVMIRHPAAFVASMKRLNWGFKPRNWALSQPAVMRDFLEPFRGELEALDARDHDIVDQTALMWKLLNYIVLRFQERHPDWVFLRHEDISADPLAGYRDLYDRFGLEFNDRARKSIEDHSSASNPNQASDARITIELNSRENIGSWRKRLSTEEVERIRARVADVSRHFYTDAEWGLNDSAA